jgi:hypothetical protein
VKCTFILHWGSVDCASGMKHRGRIPFIARMNGQRMKLYIRPGNDLTRRFPLIVEALALLRSRSCIIDGEAVACGDDGIACFTPCLSVRYRIPRLIYHFALIPYSKCVNPVALPPGRAMLATNPAPTGSGTSANTIGTVRVACCNFHCQGHQLSLSSFQGSI